MKRELYGHSYTFTRNKDFKSYIDFQNLLTKLQIKYTLSKNDPMFQYVTLYVRPDRTVYNKIRSTFLLY